MLSNIKDTGLKYKVIVWFCLIVPIVYLAALSKYVDCTSLTVWAVEFWDALFSNRIHEYYAFSAEVFRPRPHAGPYVYSMVEIIPWAVWNFPLWLSRVFTGKANCDSTACLLWSKLYLIILAHIAAFYVSRILSFFIKEKENLYTAFFFCLGFGTLFLSISYYGQDEIPYIASFLAAMYYIFCGKRKSGYILLGITICSAPFMLVPCLLFCFIRSKNLLKIFCFFILVLIADKIISFLFGWSAQSKEIASLNSLYFLGWFFKRAMMSSGNITFSYFAVSIMLLSAVAYLMKIHSEEEKNYYSVLFPALGLLAINIFSWSHCYRWFICLPFLTICVFIRGNKNKNLNCGMLFMMLFDVSMLLIMLQLNYCLRFQSLKISFIHDYWVSSGNTADFYNFFNDVLSKDALDFYCLFVGSLWGASVILILIFLFKKNWNIRIGVSQKVLLCVHCSIPLLLTVAIMLVPMLVPVEGNIYSTDTTYSDRSISLDMKSHSKVEKAFEIKQATKVSRISFRAYTWHNNYGDAKLKIIFRDSDESIISITEYPLRDVLDNDMTAVPISEMKLKAGINFVEFIVDDDISSDFAMAANTGIAGKSVRYDGADMSDVDLCLLITGK